MWFGFNTGGSPSSPFLFSAERKKKIFLTRTTEVTLDSGKDITLVSAVEHCLCSASILFNRQSSLAREWAPVGFSNLAGSTAGFVRWCLDLLFIRPS